MQMMFFKKWNKSKRSLVLITIFTLIFTEISLSKVCAQPTILVGAENMSGYLPLLKLKKIAIVANQTSLVNGKHLLDTLSQLGINVKRVFCPEHGFRGTGSAGEKIADDVDSKTGIPVKSLYGNNKKPAAKDLQDIDLVLFDLQDVGARFYTYISTMHYVMQACAEQNIPMVVLDRPNPNGFYIDGPVLQDSFASFVGMHKVPVVYGMTIGEYAMMVNGEKWLGNNLQSKLTVIKCIGYTHKSRYVLPISPSPNLPNQRAVFLYPTLCFFEGTVISVGRGTNKPFQQYGHPLLLNSETSFVPKNTVGAVNPPFVNEVCFGFDLTNNNDISDSFNEGIQLDIIINAYNNFPNKELFFNSFFKKLAGNDVLQAQIKQGYTSKQIKASWQNELDNFKQVRKKYLLYDDFE
jgi:uncharacterized protein YbbC (DUF1343 family)